jgi:uncharacterized protein (DUF2141 family)
MKRLIWIAAAVLVVAAGWQTARADGGSIRVQVTGFRNGNGDLGCALFASAEHFPSGESLARAKVAASKSGAECVFNGVLPGRYAVSVLHDENRNGKMDLVPVIGMPLEGYGVSNNKTYATHAPVFEECVFAFDGTGELLLAITLRY